VGSVFFSYTGISYFTPTFSSISIDEQSFKSALLSYFLSMAVPVAEDVNIPSSLLGI
jgi:hypothetical protein